MEENMKEFKKYYTAHINHISPRLGNFFQTEGDDLKYVLSVSPRQVWTLLSEHGELYVVAGVKRTGTHRYFLITNGLWESRDERYLWK